MDPALVGSPVLKSSTQGVCRHQGPCPDGGVVFESVPGYMKGKVCLGGSYWPDSLESRLPDSESPACQRRPRSGFTDCLRRLPPTSALEKGADSRPDGLDLSCHPADGPGKPPNFSRLRQREASRLPPASQPALLPGRLSHGLDAAGTAFRLHPPRSRHDGPHLSTTTQGPGWTLPPDVGLPLWQETSAEPKDVLGDPEDHGFLHDCPIPANYHRPTRMRGSWRHGTPDLEGTYGTLLYR
jgi:hypothetical protein